MKKKKKNCQAKLSLGFVPLVLMLRAIYNLEEEALWPLSQFISHNPTKMPGFACLTILLSKSKSSDKQTSCLFILNSEVIFISPIPPTGVSEKQLLRYKFNF